MLAVLAATTCAKCPFSTERYHSFCMAVMGHWMTTSESGGRPGSSHTRATQQGMESKHNSHATEHNTRTEPNFRQRSAEHDRREQRLQV